MSGGVVLIKNKPSSHVLRSLPGSPRRDRPPRTRPGRALGRKPSTWSRPGREAGRPSSSPRAGPATCPRGRHRCTGARRPPSPSCPPCAQGNAERTPSHSPAALVEVSHGRYDTHLMGMSGTASAALDLEESSALVAGRGMVRDRCQGPGQVSSRSRPASLDSDPDLSSLLQHLILSDRLARLAHESKLRSSKFYFIILFSNLLLKSCEKMLRNSHIDFEGIVLQSTPSQLSETFCLRRIFVQITIPSNFLYHKAVPRKNLTVSRKWFGRGFGESDFTSSYRLCEFSFA